MNRQKWAITVVVDQATNVLEFAKILPKESHLVDLQIPLDPASHKLCDNIQQRNTLANPMANVQVPTKRFAILQPASLFDSGWNSFSFNVL